MDVDHWDINIPLHPYNAKFNVDLSEGDLHLQLHKPGLEIDDTDEVKALVLDGTKKKFMSKRSSTLPCSSIQEASRW